jgi:protein translocase SecG subunit
MLFAIELLHIIVSVLLAASILVQQRASGLSATFGGSGAIAVQRRGAEKAIYTVSIWLSVGFFGLTVLRWYFS